MPQENFFLKGEGREEPAVRGIMAAEREETPSEPTHAKAASESGR